MSKKQTSLINVHKYTIYRQPMLLMSISAWLRTFSMVFVNDEWVFFLCKQTRHFLYHLNIQLRAITSVICHVICQFIRVSWLHAYSIIYVLTRCNCRESVYLYLYIRVLFVGIYITWTLRVSRRQNTVTKNSDSIEYIEKL